jgi:hypothetical protein
MSRLNTLYVALGILLAIGVLLGGAWRITGAIHKLISAISENTVMTVRLSRKLSRLDRRTDRRLDEHAERIARLEGDPHGPSQPPAYPGLPHRGVRGPGPDRARGMDPVRRARRPRT